MAYEIKILSKQNGAGILLSNGLVYAGDPDGDFVAEAGAASDEVSIYRDIDNKYIVKNIPYTSVKLSNGSQVGTSRDDCVTKLNDRHLNRASSISEFDDVYDDMAPTARQVLMYDESNSRWDASENSIVYDTTPQLGGNLDVQTYSLFTSSTDQDIVFTPNGTGSINLDGTVQFKRFTSAPTAFEGGMYADDNDNLYFGVS